jgi:hypothetical protein
VDKDKVNKAIVYFMKHVLFIPRYFVGQLVRARFARGSSGAAATDQVEDQNHYGDDQQQVDETARYVETETQKPQNQQNHEDCPKHKCLPLAGLRGWRVRLGS